MSNVIQNINYSEANNSLIERNFLSIAQLPDVVAAIFMIGGLLACAFGCLGILPPSLEFSLLLGSGISIGAATFLSIYAIGKKLIGTTHTQAVHFPIDLERPLSQSPARLEPFEEPPLNSSYNLRTSEINEPVVTSINIASNPSHVIEQPAHHEQTVENHISQPPTNILNNEELKNLALDEELWNFMSDDQIDHLFDTTPDLNCLETTQPLPTVGPSASNSFPALNSPSDTTPFNVIPMNPVIHQSADIQESVNLAINQQSYNVITYYNLYTSDPTRIENRITIHAIPEHIIQDPFYHLNLFDAQIRLNPTLKLRVNFLNPDGVKNIAEDASGLRRQYMNILLSSLLEKSTVTKIEGLYFPGIQLTREGQAVQSDIEFCEQLGRLLMYCYTIDCPTGIYFPPTMFLGIFRYSPTDLAPPFDAIAFETKLSIALALNTDKSDDSQEVLLLDSLLKRPSQWIIEDIRNLISLCSINSIDTTDIAESEDKSNFLNEFGNDIYSLNDSEIVSIIRKHRGFIKSLMEVVFKSIFDPFLLPLYHIAKGMYSLNDGRIIFTNSQECETFSEKLQGCFSKEFIAGKITLKQTDNSIWNEELSKKKNWLKNWILNKATSEELKDFIKFCTGGTSLPHNKFIIVAAQNPHSSEDEIYYPIPEGQTCRFQFLVAPEPSGRTDPNDFNDHTEENFYKCIEAVINGSSFTIQ